MLRLRTLGSLDLRHADGRAVRSVLAQPKRLGLLCYLACAPDGHRTRDELVACFWADSSEERARNALNQALHYLRRALGRNAVVTEGEHVILDQEMLTCDRVDFDGALAREDLAAALDAYGGDFLPGVHVSGCPAFERWVSSERERLRRAAADAARCVAAAEVEGGHTDAALRRLRSARSWAPFDEGVLQDLLETLARTGETVAMEREYRAFAGRLADELEIEPSAETRTLLERLRGLGVAGVSHPEAAPDPTTGSASTNAAAPLRRWAAAAALLLAAPLVHAVLSGSSPTPIPDGAVRMAVLPFAVVGAEHLEPLGEGLVDVLSLRLEVPGGIRTVDPAAVLARAGGGPGAEAAAIAAELEADRFVLGRIVQAGPRLEIAAGVYDGSGERMYARSVAVPEDSLFDGLDRLARELLTEHYRLAGVRLPNPLALQGTGSLPALKAFLEGERALRHGRFGTAVAAFQRAVDTDSLFALAHHRRAVAADWAGNFALAGQSRLAAWRLRNRLPERIRLRMHPPGADWPERERALRSALERYPADVEATYDLAEVLFHQAGRGTSIAEIRTWFERVLRHDPHDTGALLHLAALAAFEGNLPALDSLVSFGLSEEAEGLRATEFRALRVMAMGSPQDREGVIREMRGLNDENLVRTFLFASRYSAAYEAARDLETALTDPARSPYVRSAAALAGAFHRAGTGEHAEALARLDAEPEVPPRLALSTRAILLSSPIWPTTPEEARATLADLGEWDRLPAVEGPLSVFPFGRLGGAHMPFMLRGLLHVRLGEPAEAREMAAGLTRMGKEDPLAGRAARLVLASLALSEGRPDEGLALLGEPDGAEYAEPTGLETFVRAELLTAAGREREALRWYVEPLHAYVFGMVLVRPARERVARLTRAF